MREQEKAYFEKKKKEFAAAQNEASMHVHNEIVSPAMEEIQAILVNSGDTVSHEGMEAIAKWKLGIK